MSTQTITPTTAPSLLPPSVATRGPILVASDGTATSEPAVVAARMLASRLGASVQLVSVVPPMTPIMPSPEGLVMPADDVAERVARRRDQLRDEMTRLLGAADEWPVDVRVGVPAVEIADIAEETRAQLVVAGLVHHGRFARLLQGETPIGILHKANVPTLAVPPGMQQLPRCVMVAVDLTDASVAAASFARPLLAEAETVYLVHVQPRVDVGPPMASASWDRAYQEAVGRAYARVTAALELPPGVHGERKLLAGNIAHELLDFADFARVDLIVAGHRHRTLVERLLTGGIATRLFRGASTAILMVPEVARGATGVDPSLGAREDLNAWLTDRGTWASYLEAFTQRNAGRRTRLDIHNAQLGAQTTVTGSPLVGIDYDGHAGVVDIMLGDFAGTGRHLTHTARRTQSIEVYRHADGRDGALRISDRFGHAILTFLP